MSNGMRRSVPPSSAVHGEGDADAMERALGLLALLCDA
jgi:hypothetical protein